MKFWMIKKNLRDNEDNPKRIIYNKGDAVNEMLRLAKHQPGDTFYLLEAVEWANCELIFNMKQGECEIEDSDISHI